MADQPEPAPVTADRPLAGRRIVVTHETGGQKYLAMLVALAEREGFEIRFFETMIERELLRRAAHLRRLPPGMAAFWWKNWRFRLGVPSVRADAIVVGMGPWDYRMLWYGRLVRRNRVIYHASWPDWTGGPVPRGFGRLDGWLAKRWGAVFAHPNAEVVAVTPMVACSIRARFPEARVSVIPHVAHGAFFAARRQGERASDAPLRVIQVGEVSTKKGIRLWPEILARFGDRPIEVTLVGDGPLGGEARAMAKTLPITVAGYVGDRDRLAAMLAAHDVLLVPSQRTPRWEELFGMVVVEAQAAGVVPIASAHVGPRQLIEDGVDGFLLEEDDLDGFAARLTRLAEQPDVLARMREAAMVSADRYHPDVVAGLWRERLLAAVRNPPAG